MCKCFGLLFFTLRCWHPTKQSWSKAQPVKIIRKNVTFWRTPHQHKLLVIEFNLDFRGACFLSLFYKILSTTAVFKTWLVFSFLFKLCLTHYSRRCNMHAIFVMCALECMLARIPRQCIHSEKRTQTQCVCMYNALFLMFFNVGSFVFFHLSLATL